MTKSRENGPLSLCMLYFTGRVQITLLSIIRQLRDFHFDICMSDQYMNIRDYLPYLWIVDVATSHDNQHRSTQPWDNRQPWQEQKHLQCPMVAMPFNK